MIKWYSNWARNHLDCDIVDDNIEIMGSTILAKSVVMVASELLKKSTKKLKVKQECVKTP